MAGKIRPVKKRLMKEGIVKEEYKELIKPRTIFAFLFYMTFCWLVMINKEVPQELNTIISVTLGFYFGNRTKKIDKNNVENNSHTTAS